MKFNATIFRGNENIKYFISMSGNRTHNRRVYSRTLVSLRQGFKLNYDEKQNYKRQAVESFLQLYRFKRLS